MDHLLMPSPAALHAPGCCGNMNIPMRAYVADLSRSGDETRNFGLLGSTIGVCPGFAHAGVPALPMLGCR